MILSINPTYYCNFRCEFCYLTEEQLSDRQLLSLEDLNKHLADITAVYQIEMVDIYGGEIGLICKTYWDKMIDLLHVYGIEDINLITNLSMINEITEDPRVYTSVSYDFKGRESSDRVFRNMALLNKPFSILMLAGPKVIFDDVDLMVTYLNTLKNLQSLEIKPYSSNQANQFRITNKMFEDFVKKWIIHPNRKFQLTNNSLLESVINKSRNAFSDDHIYITPSGKMAVLEFDLNDNEFFLEINSIEEYDKWCETEKARVKKNKYCSNCEYLGSCLSEHLRDVKSLEDSCNGFKHLIDWYKNGRVAS